MITGKLLAAFDQAKEAGCILAESREVYSHLMIATDLNPCEGCWVNAKDCAAFKRYHTAARTEVKSTSNTNKPGLNGLTMRQIADQLGISLSEARRRKAAGTL